MSRTSQAGAFLRIPVGRSLVFALLILGVGTMSNAQTSSEGPAPEPVLEAVAADEPHGGLVTDIRLYFTAPLHWDATDWAWFGGTLLAIAAAHHYDSQVRSHFVKNLAPGQTVNSDDVQDAIPTVAVLGATWAYANLIDDNNGRREAWTMFEAAGLSTVTAYALKYAIAREGPDETSDTNEWFKRGGKSFPSEHATAAFAVGTVLAESGNDEFRWVRRVLGYGLGVFTSYERLKHNAHWLSDTVAGAALGGASANFSMHRDDRAPQDAHLSIVPIPGGAMLRYRADLQ
jgi:membrane-associated phospholipid phosphatase